LKVIYLARVSIFLITVALIAGMVGCDGTSPSQNLEIRTWYDLDAIRDNLDGNYILMNDLDSATAGYEELASPTTNGGKGWLPIGYGYWDGYWVGEMFEGTFDGQGYEIRDLFINRPEEDHVGLFGIVGEGVVKDIGVVNVAVTGRYCVGGLVGANDHTVGNCYVIGSVIGEHDVGGLVGTNLGRVSECYSAANVTGDEDVGGLVGASATRVDYSYSTGSVTGNLDVGGLVGLIVARGTVSKSYSTCSVTGKQYVGGLVGYNSYASVDYSYSTGGVTGNLDVGGLVGENHWGSVYSAFWDIETSGQPTSAGGTGKTTAEMKSIATFLGGIFRPGWDICRVTSGSTKPTYTWNIVDDEAYPFLSWQPVV
jgi:hypothetical protein